MIASQLWWSARDTRLFPYLPLHVSPRQCQDPEGFSKGKNNGPVHGFGVLTLRTWKLSKLTAYVGLIMVKRRRSRLQRVVG